MKSITIHNLDDPLNSLIRERARQEGLSLNKTIKKILSVALGVDDTLQHQANEFSDLSGVWNKEDGNEFDKNTANFGVVDDEDWQ